MNLRKDHYRDPRGTEARAPKAPRGRTVPKPPWAGRARWRRPAAGSGARLPFPDAHGIQRNASTGGGSPPVVEARGRDRFGRPSLRPAPGGENLPSAGRAGYRTSPAALYPGGRMGLGRFGSLETGLPSRGGSAGRAPGRSRPRRAAPVRRGRPPAQARTTESPTERHTKNTSKENQKSKTLSGGSLGSRVDEERS